MSDPSFDRAARDLIRFVQSPDFRRAAEAVQFARDHEAEIEHARLVLAESRAARESLITVRDSLTRTGVAALATSDAERLYAAQGLAVLVAGMDRYVRTAANASRVIEEALSSQVVRPYITAMSTLLRSGIASPPESGQTPPAPTKRREQPVVDVDALVEIAESGDLDDLDLDAFAQGLVGKPVLELFDVDVQALVRAHNLSLEAAGLFVAIVTFLVWSAVIVTVQEVLPEDGLTGAGETFLDILNWSPLGAAALVRKEHKRRFPPIEVNPSGGPTEVDRGDNDGNSDGGRGKGGAPRDH